MRTPPPRAAKAAGMKTPAFKPISTRQASSKIKKGKQTARVIFSQVQSKADSHVEKVAVSKRESHVEKEAFISKKVFDVFRKEVRQEFKGVREEFTRIRQLVKKRFKKMVKANEQIKQQHEDSDVEAQQMDYAGVETSPQQFSPTVDQNLDENQGGTKNLKYDPNRSYKFSTVDYNFMNIIRFVHDVDSADAANLTAGEQVEHLNEYINRFCMHAAVPWHIVGDMYIPVNIKEKYHWVLAILSFSERIIFLYNAYESSNHYPPVLDVIEKLAVIIPLCLQQFDFYVKKGIDVENNPRYKDKNSSDMFDVSFQKSLPQQSTGSLDFGVYMVTYAECLSYGHKVLANEFDPNALRTRYAALLWDYGTRK
ncbi:hypothetical protein CQW23_14626 [Capsicum baccatum]|uniref:Ubiquitin-like protease family profile domain-containing protein n=1 Tax=Capsicum baccatum TaxID=33114 RepID=A0A2G2WJQ2_CAPBA|nr:hypothetical protein CQW23_14626 [Capsicum baccatum]